MKKHFVTFQSPGTFFSEETEKPIGSWDVELAKEMAGSVSERHGATPYAFYFTTRERGPEDLDSRETKRSGRYFLGGRLLNAEQVKAEFPDSEILVSNMRCNKWKHVVVNNNSFRAVQPFEKGDTLLDYMPPAKRQTITPGCQ